MHLVIFLRGSLARVLSSERFSLTLIYHHILDTLFLFYFSTLHFYFTKFFLKFQVEDLLTKFFSFFSQFLYLLYNIFFKFSTERLIFLNFGGALTQPLSHRLGRKFFLRTLFFILHIYFTKFFLKNQIRDLFRIGWICTFLLLILQNPYGMPPMHSALLTGMLPNKSLLSRT